MLNLMKKKFYASFLIMPQKKEIEA